MRPSHFELVDGLLSLELAPLLLVEGLDEELSLGVLLMPPLLGEVVSELVLPVLGELVVPELMLPPPEGAPASDPAEGLPVLLAPDAPEELSLAAPDAAGPELPLAPAPCAHDAVAKTTIAEASAALMSLAFICLTFLYGWVGRTARPITQEQCRRLPASIVAL